MSKMSTRNLTQSPTDLITLKTKGWQLVTYYDGEEMSRENLKVKNRYTRDLKQYHESVDELKEVEVEGSGEKLQFSAQDTEKMAQTYASVKYKYTHKHTKYSSTGKYWQFFEKAAALAREYKIYAYTYITIIRNHYTGRIRENRVAFPWPSQLGGVSAEEIISNHIANKSTDVPQEVLALRKAQAKRNLPLDQDEDFLAAKRRFKTDKFNREDFEYVKIRYNQVGKTPSWLDKFEKKLEDRERNER